MESDITCQHHFALLQCEAREVPLNELECNVSKGHLVAQHFYIINKIAKAQSFFFTFYSLNMIFCHYHDYYNYHHFFLSGLINIYFMSF